MHKTNLWLTLLFLSLIISKCYKIRALFIDACRVYKTDNFANITIEKNQYNRLIANGRIRNIARGLFEE